MGKKSKSQNLKHLMGTSTLIQNSSVQKVENKNQIVKISKKEMRKIKKENKKLTMDKRKDNFRIKDAQQQQIEILDQKNMQQQKQQIIYSSDQQNLISVSSQQQQGQQDKEEYSQQLNDIQLNEKGKQGFEELINSSSGYHQKNVKFIQVQSIKSHENQHIIYLYQIKRQVYYKISCSDHEKLNITHLNSSINITVIQENLNSSVLLDQNKSNDAWYFEINGKLIPKKVQFTKSTILKVTNEQAYSNDFSNNKKSKESNLTKTKKISNRNSTKQILKQKINRLFNPFSSQESDKIVDFLGDFEWSDQCLLVSRQKLNFQSTKKPFSNIDLKMLMASNDSLMILGKKNTGKSTFAQHLKNRFPQKACILDCDIGRSLTISGCVSLLTQQQTINIWIGEFTPFNCLSKYVDAIKQLYRIYRQKHFSKKLIINTMGYLNGLGEMILYQIYNIINPKEIVALIINGSISVMNDQMCEPQRESEKQNDNDSNLENILFNIRTGNYLKKLFTQSISKDNSHGDDLRKFNQKKLSLNVQYLKNHHAQTKGIPIRFQNLLIYKKNISNIVELIRMIKSKQFEVLQNLNFYSQDKLGNITRIHQQQNCGNMRIVLIGEKTTGKQRENQSDSNLNENDTCNSSTLFRIFGIGYGFENKVFFSKDQIEKIICPKVQLKQMKQNLIAILSDNIDFEKNFYLINEASLIHFQLQYGNLPFIMPIIKAIGSKGIRNNPSKNS